MQAGMIRRAMVGVAVVAAASVGAAAPGHAGAFPGQNGRVVFAKANPSTGMTDIVVDNTNNVTNTANVTELRPAWDPSGNRIAFQRLVDTQFDIFVVNVSANGQPSGMPLNLTNSPAQDQHPTWNQTGTRIAFDSDRTGELEVFTMDPRGGALRNVSRDANRGDVEPTFKPDDGRVAWSKSVSGQLDIWAATDGTGTGPAALTNTPSLSEREVSFRPDGLSYVFVSKSSRNEHRVLAAPVSDPSATTTLVDTGEVVGGPKCSPDGQFLVYTRVTADGSSTDVMRRSCQPGGSTFRLIKDAFGADYQRLSG